MIRRALLLLIGVFVAVAVTFGQSVTASLLGVVHDASGAVIPNAEVTATNLQTMLTRTTKSDATGAYLFTDLPIGQYQLRVVSPGFQAFQQSGITLDVNANARVDATLVPGKTTQTVRVTAESTGVDTRTAALGELGDPRRVQDR